MPKAIIALLVFSAHMVTLPLVTTTPGAIAGWVR